MKVIDSFKKPSEKACGVLKMALKVIRGKDSRLFVIVLL